MTLWRLLLPVRRRREPSNAPSSHKQFWHNPSLTIPVGLKSNASLPPLQVAHGAPHSQQAPTRVKKTDTPTLWVMTVQASQLHPTCTQKCSTNVPSAMVHAVLTAEVCSFMVTCSWRPSAVHHRVLDCLCQVPCPAARQPRHADAPIHGHIHVPLACHVLALSLHCTQHRR